MFLQVFTWQLLVFLNFRMMYEKFYSCLLNVYKWIILK